MSVRVVARIRPLLHAEIEKDVIIEPTGDSAVVKIPNPRCQSETFSFQLNSVYDRETTQAKIFEEESECNGKSYTKPEQIH